MSPTVVWRTKTDDEVYALLFPGRGAIESAHEQPDWARVHGELGRVGVTLKQFGASGRTAFDGEGFDELGHHAPPLAPVLVRVAGDDLLVRAVREGERLVRGVGEQIVGARLLPVGAQGRGLEQDPPALVERPWCRAVPSVRAGAGSAPRKPATHGPQGPALPFMAARGTAAPARALPRPGRGRAEPLGVPGLA